MASFHSSMNSLSATRAATAAAGRTFKPLNTNIEQGRTQDISSRMGKGNPAHRTPSPESRANIQEQLGDIQRQNTQTATSPKDLLGVIQNSADEMASINTRTTIEEKNQTYTKSIDDLAQAAYKMAQLAKANPNDPEIQQDFREALDTFRAAADESADIGRPLDGSWGTDHLSGKPGFEGTGTAHQKYQAVLENLYTQLYPDSAPASNSVAPPPVQMEAPQEAEPENDGIRSNAGKHNDAIEGSPHDGVPINLDIAPPPNSFVEDFKQKLSELDRKVPLNERFQGEISTEASTDVVQDSLNKLDEMIKSFIRSNEQHSPLNQENKRLLKEALEKALDYADILDNEAAQSYYSNEIDNLR